MKNACILCVIYLFGACHPGVRAPEPGAVRAGKFLRTGAPPEAPALFQSHIMSAFGIRRTPVFTGDGTQLFWSADRGQFRSVIMTARLHNGVWTNPTTLPFSAGEFFDHNPAVSHDGRMLVFASNRPIAGKPATTIEGTPVPTSDLWVVYRTSRGWTQPEPLPPAFNTSFDDDCPVLAADGTLYFSSARPGSPGPGAIFVAQRRGRTWSDPALVPIVSSAAGEMVTGVAPDQSYLVFWSMRTGADAGLYVSFRDAAGAWLPPVRMPDALIRMRAYAASVTPDGTTLLFTALVEKVPRIFVLTARMVHALR